LLTGNIYKEETDYQLFKDYPSFYVNRKLQEEFCGFYLYNKRVLKW